MKDWPVYKDGDGNPSMRESAAAKKRPSILTVCKQEAKAVSEWPDYLKIAFGVKS